MTTPGLSPSIARCDASSTSGDTVWIRGEVASKETKIGEYRVTINIKAEDHRDEVTAIGTATVLLPSRTSGPVTLPPKLDLASAG